MNRKKRSSRRRQELQEKNVCIYLLRINHKQTARVFPLFVEAGLFARYSSGLFPSDLTCGFVRDPGYPRGLMMKVKLSSRTNTSGIKLNISLLSHEGVFLAFRQHRVFHRLKLKLIPNKTFTPHLLSAPASLGTPQRTR